MTPLSGVVRGQWFLWNVDNSISTPTLKINSYLVIPSAVEGSAVFKKVRSILFILSPDFCLLPPVLLLPRRRFTQANVLDDGGATGKLKSIFADQNLIAGIISQKRFNGGKLVFTKSSLSRSAMLGIVALAGLALTAPQAHAGFIVDISQVGSNVVATGSGTLNTYGYTEENISGTPAELWPSIAVVILGSGVDMALSLGISGPTSIGGNVFDLATSASGESVGLDGAIPWLIVPGGYTSGAPLSDSATFDNTTIAELGVTPGTYIWTWGTGPNADFFEITTTPEPTSVVLVGSAMLGLLALRRRIAR